MTERKTDRLLWSIPRGAGRAEVRARKVHRRRDGAERGGSLPLLSGRELNKKFCERVETFT